MPLYRKTLEALKLHCIKNDLLPTLPSSLLTERNKEYKVISVSSTGQTWGFSYDSIWYVIETRFPHRVRKVTRKRIPPSRVLPSTAQESKRELFSITFEIWGKL